MKKLFTLAIAASFLTMGSAQTQSLMFFEDYNGGAIANGSSLTVAGSSAAALLESEVKAGLNTGPSKDVNVKRYETSLLAGTGNYFCWGLCYLEQPAGQLPYWESGAPLFAMTPGTTVPNFHAYFTPNNVVGSMSFRYVWFDMNNPADSSWLDITFQSDPVGINELLDPVVDFSIFPNPASGEQTTVSVELQSGQTGALVVHNALGEQLFLENLSANSQNIELPVGKLDGGIYFVSVSLDGSLKRTERLVVR